MVDGAPPIGWDAASHYLVVPVLLVIAQYISSAIISPPVDPNNENAGTQKAILGLLPLMIGWFALNVPSGLRLYYLSNTVLTSATQVFLRKLGGADLKDFDLGPIDLGKARRSGVSASAASSSSSMASTDGEAGAAAAGAEGGVGGPEAGGNGAEGAVLASVGAGGEVAEVAAAPAVPAINRRCKRRRWSGAAGVGGAPASTRQPLPLSVAFWACLRLLCEPKC